ncbi:MAG: HNH nuclease family protein [Magnetococcales bacterium]|nr:HNH nuclease family protein [Magnetococcales bacterium]
MAIGSYSTPRPRKGLKRPERLDSLVRDARQNRDTRMAGYREQSLRIHPLVCARCGRVFERDNLVELTVHHKDHNHDHNPPDGSNWENLCIYCHDNEHARQVEYQARGGDDGAADPEPAAATHSPFANLKELLAGNKL